MNLCRSSLNKFFPSIITKKNYKIIKLKISSKFTKMNNCLAFYGESLQKKNYR